MTIKTTKTQEITFYTMFCALFAFSAALFGATPEPSDPTQRLEDDFFEILWRLDSPILVERNVAENELTRRFAELEPIWQNRDFLTNGEISAEARYRFGWVELRNRADVKRRTLDSFRTSWNVGPVETSESDDVETRSCRVRISWNETTRIVYLTPDWRSFVWRDPTDGTAWRPRERFSTPEISPQLDATTLEIDATLERADDKTDAINETKTKKSNVEAKSGSFDVLLGADFRELVVPLDLEIADVADAKTDDDSTLLPDKNRLQTLQSGDLTFSFATLRRQKNGETTAFFRLDFSEAFDAFDSHRVWFDKNDFSVSLEVDGKNDATATAKIGGESRTFAPIRLRTRSRNAGGVSFELDFSETATVAFEQAARNGGAVRLCCRVPRFFLFARILLDDATTE